VTYASHFPTGAGAVEAPASNSARTTESRPQETLARLPVLIRPVRIADKAYVRNSFAEGHKGAPGVVSMTWRYYKRFIVPELEHALQYPSTEVLAAYDATDTIVGWLAFARGQRVSTIHWAHTRFKIGDGADLRRRGVMTQLIDAARLGDRIAYTFKGAYPKHRSGETLDEKLLPWLAGRGQFATYYPFEEWLK
jgi:hypothetical protein